MNYFEVILLSIVEGITEFLPISSTGHLVLTSYILGIQQTEFVKSFEIIIQLGAILAVVVLYWQKLIKNLKIWQNIIAAFIPTAIIGFILYKFIKEVLIGNPYITLAALFLGGVVLIILEKMHHEKKDSGIADIEKLTFKKSMLIGLIQSLSIIPGVSRSGASIIGGLLLGLKRKAAVEFSFLLAIPTMFGATFLDLFKTKFNFTLDQLLLLTLGFILSFIVALLVIKWFLKYIQKYTFIPFAIYRIILSFLYLLYLLYK